MKNALGGKADAIISTPTSNNRSSGQLNHVVAICVF